MRLAVVRISYIKIILVITIGALLSSNNASAQGWRGIEPIESTCKDVERLFGGSACGKQNVEYRLSDATVVFVFAARSCHEKWPYEEYNVLPGTVTFVRVFLRRSRVFISDFNVDKSKLRQDAASDQLDIFEYKDRELGMEIEASEDGQVLTLTRLPAAKYDHLHCASDERSANEPTAYGIASHLIGEYYPPAPDREKSLFSELVSELKKYDKVTPESRKATVYIVAYAGQRARSGEAKQLAERAKICLVREYDVDAKRIIEIDGGYRERAVVHLFIRRYGVPAPQISPTIHPSDVELIKDRENNKP